LEKNKKDTDMNQYFGKEQKGNRYEPVFWKRTKKKQLLLKK
jgi:hypothetical protein